jgi:hypothetical protein
MLFGLYLSLVLTSSQAVDVHCEAAAWKKEMSVQKSSGILAGELQKICVLDFGSSSANWDRLWNESMLSIIQPGTESLLQVLSKESYSYRDPMTSEEMFGTRAVVKRINKVSDESGDNTDAFETTQTDSLVQNKSHTQMILTMRASHIEPVGKGKALRGLEIRMVVVSDLEHKKITITIESGLGLKNPFIFLPDRLFNSVAPRISRNKFESTVKTSLVKTLKSLTSN